MEKLLFIGYTYHLKTRSADFMVDLLESRYDVKRCHLDLDRQKATQTIKQHAGEYETVILWQVMPNMALIHEHIRYARAAFFPMADGCPSVWKIERWLPYYKMQIICFSSTLHKELLSAGLPSSHLRFYPEPLEPNDMGDVNSAFFWARRNDIASIVFNKLNHDAPYSKLHVHLSADPGQNIEAPESNDHLTITSTTWVESKDDLRAKVCESAIYIAPRMKEGIGMSFLEAMAMGRCVIAPDSITMNEYITHGVNGILYSHHKPSLPKSMNIREIQQNALSTIRLGYAQWQVEKMRIFSILREQPTPRRNNLIIRIAIRAFKNPFKLGRALVAMHRQSTSSLHNCRRS